MDLRSITACWSWSGFRWDLKPLYSLRDPGGFLQSETESLWLQNAKPKMFLQDALQGCYGDSSTLQLTFQQKAREMRCGHQSTGQDGG